MPLSPKELSEQIDGRRRTRKIAGKRAEDDSKGGKRAAIAREFRNHDNNCTRSNQGNRQTAWRPRMFDSFDGGVIFCQTKITGRRVKRK